MDEIGFDVADLITDENLENNGTIFPLAKGSSLLVARGGNNRYNRMLDKEVDAQRLALDPGPAPDDAALDAVGKVSDEIMVKVMARTILLGWTKMVFEKKSIEYSVENAEKMLRVKDFRKMVARFADQTDAYKLKAEVEAGKT